MPITAGKIRHFHEGLIDFMIANPSAKTTEIAAHFNRNKQTISMIINNDMFKVRFHQRRKEYQSTLHEKLADQTMRLANAGLQELITRVEENPAKVPFLDLANVTDKALERLGYGIRPSAPGININAQGATVTVTPEVLHSAQQKLRAAEQAKLIEHEDHVGQARENVS